MGTVKFITAGLLIITGISVALAFSEAEITHYWRQSSPGSTVVVNHSAWDKLLKHYLATKDGVNLFAYNTVADSDRTELNNYITRLQSIPVSELHAKEQFAFWINLYNAVTVKVVLDHYPVRSIREISPNLLARGPWTQKLVNIEGISLSLDNIEHQILRPVFRDSRIHYAVSCASMGCPNLQADAFTRRNLEHLLDLGARQYINHPRGVSLDQDKLTVSSIYDWYGEDFGESDHEIIGHFRRYATEDLKQLLQNRQSIDDFKYDWALNE